VTARRLKQKRSNRLVWQLLRNLRRFDGRLMSACATSRQFAAPQNSSPIGLTTDNELRERRIGAQRMTQKQHWLCTAAMVLMPVSAPIKALG
jgi:hypothetical protein